jgi:hypothetical protein
MNYEVLDQVGAEVTARPFFVLQLDISTDANCYMSISFHTIKVMIFTGNSVAGKR